MELKDTVKGMTSKDYKERFVAEYCQLCIRLNKLKKFIGKIMYAKCADQEEPAHDCPVDMLTNQVVAMKLYKVVLIERAKLESIELPEFEEVGYNA